MKKELLDALKAKFTGVSEAILSRIADKLAKTVTTAEQVQAAVDAYTWQQVIDGYGDSRATEAQQTAVHTYEAKYGLKDGQKIDGGAGTGGQAGSATVVTTYPAGGAEEVPAWAKALIDSNKALTDRLDKMDGERTTATRKQQLSAVIDKLPENLRKGYSRTSVDNLSDDEFNTLLGEITTEVETISGSIAAKGAVFGKPAAHGSQTTQNALTKEQEAAISQREGMPKDGQQPF
jgi:hypothetical protein|nr:MAG TPA: hypothetical protein [Caudoviricetes sp.]